MLAHIERACARHEVDPARLVIEITETAAISDMDRAPRVLRGRRTALGCAIALDDFGAGFGSFQYLKQLPFDYLKIDGDFIRELPASPTDQLVVQALVGRRARAWARRRSPSSSATSRRCALLRGYGVDYAQGFEVGSRTRAR